MFKRAVLLAAASIAIAFAAPASAQQLPSDMPYVSSEGQGGYHSGHDPDEEKFAQVQDAYYQTCGDATIYNITFGDLDSTAQSRIRYTPMGLIEMFIGQNCGNHDLAEKHLRR